MLVKFMARGAGGGAGPVDYLLGRDRQREGASVLRGDPEQVRELIDSADFSRNYTSAVLSFEESEISDDLRQKCMDEFEAVLMPGMEADQYTALWIEHNDKGRVELNVLIPNVELQSGKRLQPYYDRADRPRVDAWKTAINAEHNLADPSDPTRKRALTTAADLPRERKELAEAITRGLMAQVGEGQIKSRADVLEALQGIGLEVSRETKSSISIKAPDGGQNVRLKGAIYERDFELSQGLRGEIERAGADYTRERAERAKRARERLNTMSSSRAKENATRYKRPQQPRDMEHGRDLANGHNHDLSHHGVRRGGVDLAKQRDSEPLRATGQATERSSDPVRRPAEALHRDRSDSDSVREKGRISDHQRRLSNDRDRAAVSAGTTGDRDGAQSHAADVHNFTKRVRASTQGERPASGASDALSRASGGLEQAKQGVERAIHAVHAASEHIKKLIQKQQRRFFKRRTPERGGGGLEM